VEELAEISAIEFGPNEVTNLVEGWLPEDAEEAVVSACPSLIAIIDDQGSKIVQFSHFSVKEFMTSDRLQTSNIGYICDYYIPLEEAHTLLARACIKVLLQLDEKTDRERVATFPLVKYASKRWLDPCKVRECPVTNPRPVPLPTGRSIPLPSNRLHSRRHPYIMRCFVGLAS
jgi:hypothetical protein